MIRNRITWQTLIPIMIAIALLEPVHGNELILKCSVGKTEAAKKGSERIFAIDAKRKFVKQIKIEPGVITEPMRDPTFTRAEIEFQSKNGILSYKGDYIEVFSVYKINRYSLAYTVYAFSRYSPNSLFDKSINFGECVKTGAPKAQV